MKYRLLALDLDGTVLRSDGAVAPATIQAIARAKSAGLTVALCTGRGLKEAQQVIDTLHHTGPLILANGALISDPLTGRTLHRATMEPHVSMPVIEALVEGDDAVLVLLDPEVVDHDYLIIRPERMNANTKWWFDYVGASYRGVARATEDDLHHAVRVGIVGPASHMPGVESKLTERFGPSLFVQHFMAVAEDEDAGEPVHVLEVFNRGVNKWAGLDWLCEAEGYGAEEIIAIGDHINDVEMIAGAGCGIAMGNAVPEVRQVANYQTLDNDHDGVARAIGHILAGEW